MIVDDSLNNRLVASGFLEDDYDIEVAESGEECLQNISKFQPDVVLIDWMMPPPDGIETMRKIREEMTHLRNVKFVMLTAKTQAEDIVTAWRAGASDYIVKPFEMDTMLNIVAQQLMEKQRLDNLDAEKAEIEAHLQQAQKMEAIGVLAGGIAHDFNNILFPILGYTEMTLSNPEATDDIKDNLHAIERAAWRARDLVRQIMTFSRQSNGEAYPVNVGLILKEVLKLLKASFPANIKLIQHIESDCGHVFADPTQIHQIIMNLCTNAKHAMEESGGILTVGLRNVPPDEPLLADMKGDLRYAELSVSDTGVGILPEIRDKIFQPFFTTKDVGKGTGMGLSVVHGIVEHFNGQIRLESEIGKGSIFRIFFPISGEKCASAISRNKEITGGTERILLVDDEPVITAMLSKILNDLGYRVKAFTRCSELIAEFSRNGADILITDMSMPEMTGVELAEKIWQEQSGFPVILMTGFSEMMTKEKAKALGIREFMMKPIVTADLAQAIRRVFQRI